jgi:hypothetical protein
MHPASGKNDLGENRARETAYHVQKSDVICHYNRNKGTSNKI